MKEVIFNHLIRASAGTGKTYRLSSRFIELIARGTMPQEILATTFTRKAAGEILDRVFERLAKAVLSDANAKEVSDSIKLDESPEFFGLQLEKIIGSLNKMQIATLDAFFAQVARAFTLELGLPVDWRIIEETDMDLVKDDAIRQVLASSDAREIIYLLAKGDSEVSVGRMVRQTIDSLYETFLESSHEAWNRIQSKAPDDNELDNIIAALRDLADDFSGNRIPKALRNDADRIANQDFVGAIKLTIPQTILDGENKYFGQPLDERIVDVYSRLIEFVRQHQMNLLAMQNEGAYRLLDIYHGVYERMEDTEGGLRFDSVNRRVGRLLANNDPEQINYRLDQNIRHLLLDEFQDTSLTQWSVLQPFAISAVNNKVDGSLFCVGDTKQAIYGWRGGVAEIFDEVEESLNEDSEKQELVQSRRSSQPVIDAVNQVFQNASVAPALGSLKPAVKSWQERFGHHTVFNTEMPGYVTLERVPESEDVSVREYAANRITELANDHPDKTIGVLVRTNKIVAELIFYLGLRGIRASEEGGNTLLDSAAVNIISSLLHLIDHPADRVALFHVAHSPLAKDIGLGKIDPAKKELTDEEQVLIRGVCQEIRVQVGQIGLSRLIEKWSKRLLPHCTLREQTRLNQLVEMAFAYADGDDNISIFRKRIENSSVDDPSGAEVRVMTIHQAKGLEFDIVVLPNLDCSLSRTRNDFIVGRDSPTGPITSVCKYIDKNLHRLMPEQIQQSYSDHIEREVTGELCLLYVAMTRAIHALHMIVNEKARPEHKEWQGIILATLNDGTDDERYVWTRGNPDWDEGAFGKKGDDKSLESLIGVNPHSKNEYVNQIKLPKQKRPSRMLPFTSPSRKEGGSQVMISDLLRSSENYAAMSFGTLIHACFEGITWLESGLPDETFLRDRLSLIEGATSDDIDFAIGAFADYVNQPNIKSFLTRETYFKQCPFGKESTVDFMQTAEVENERAFAVRQDNGILQGFIDRLVTVGDLHAIRFANVIDFKSDKIAPGDDAELQRRIDWYRPQLDGYRYAVSKMLHIEPSQVACHLVFVTVDQVVDIGL